MLLESLSLCCFIITSIAGITLTFMNDQLHIFKELSPAALQGQLFHAYFNLHEDML